MQLGRQAVDWFDRYFGPIRETAAARILLAQVLQAAEQLDAARHQARCAVQTLDGCRGTGGSDVDDLVAALLTAGNLERLSGRTAQATDDLDRAVTLTRQACGDGGLDTAAAVNARAQLHVHMGEHAAAERLYFDALEVFGRHGARHAVAAVHRNIAALYSAWQRPHAALAWAERSLAAHRDILAGDDPQIGLDVAVLGLLEYKLGDYDAAERAYREALAILERSPRSRPRDVSVVHGNLAALLADTGRVQQALDAYALALQYLAMAPDAAA